MNTKLTEKRVEIECSNESCRFGRRHTTLPQVVINGAAFKEEYRNQDMAGFFISPCGYAYCSRQCWADFCGD